MDGDGSGVVPQEPVDDGDAGLGVQARHKDDRGGHGTSRREWFSNENGYQHHRTARQPERSRRWPETRRAP
ncbi:hypothetical protein GCM10010517_37980 [Streptosporangium fragile]|uniref:Uncharacterized protein n=1 Tax=Streptosporangium fragile TaxID=46186 RepID=A0ABN3VZC8_9ACTN